MSNKYIYVYQTVCEPNGKTYVGVHATNNMNDGYIGCGIVGQSSCRQKTAFHNAVTKYGYTSFRRYILSFYDTYQEALEEESYIVNSEWVKLDSNYNCALGGKGSTLDWMTENERIAHCEKYKGEKNHRYGKKAHNRKSILKFDLTGNFIEKYDSVMDAANSVNQAPTNVSNCCIGKYGKCAGFIFRYENYTEEEQEKLNINLSKRQRIYKSDGSWEMSEECKKKLAKAKPNRKGIKMSEEARKKMALAKLGKKRGPHSEETKKKIGEANRKK